MYPYNFRLEQGEIQVEDTIFILQNYVRFH